MIYFIVKYKVFFDTGAKSEFPPYFLTTKELFQD